MNNRSSHYIPLHERYLAAILMKQRHETGKTVADIHRETEISRNQLYLLESKYQEDQTMVDLERTGRPRKVDALMERRIIRAVEKEPFKDSLKLVKEANSGLEEKKKITAGTLRRYALRNGLFARMPRAKPPLTPLHIEQRLEFANLYKGKDMRFWRNVLFCDEVSFQLFPPDRRQRVRRRKDLRNEPKNLVKSYKHGGGNLMFWGCIGYNGQGSLVLVDGNLNGEKYAQILRENIPRTLRFLNMHSAYILEDNAPTHQTQRVKSMKEELGVRDLPNYPANSPDLNPIEGVWDYWKVKVRARNPRSLGQLQMYAFDEWRKLNVNILRPYILSMPKRLQQVYDRKGGHTIY